MSKITLNGFVLLLLLFLGNSSGKLRSRHSYGGQGSILYEPLQESQSASRNLDEGGTGTLQKMIVENGSVTMDLDLNRLTSQGFQSPAGETRHPQFRCRGEFLLSCSGF